MYKLPKENRFTLILVLILVLRDAVLYGINTKQFYIYLVLLFAVLLLGLKKVKPKEIKESPKCEDGYSPKYFLIEKHGVLKAYKADGLRIGEFMGYATWDDNLGEFKISKT